MIEFDLGDSKFFVWPERKHAATHFWDGKVVEAEPEDNEAYRETAHELGYGDDTWAMCFEHELFHTLIAKAEGHRWSPTLRAVATGTTQDLGADVIAEEESMVLEFQKKLNQCRRACSR